MSTVAADPPAELAQLRQHEAEMIQERDEAQARLAEYEPKQAAAREQHYFTKGTKRPLGNANSALQKLLDAEQKDLAALRSLEADLSAIRVAIEARDAAVREQKTAEARKEVEQLNEKEEAIWESAGALFEQLVSTWGEHGAIVRETRSLARANGLDASDTLAVEPAPETFRDFVGLLLDVCLDPTGQRRTPDREEQLLDSGPIRTETGELVHRIRPAGTRLVQVRRPADHHDRLIAILPDLRGRA
jgi:hypothetical protein